MRNMKKYNRDELGRKQTTLINIDKKRYRHLNKDTERNYLITINYWVRIMETEQKEKKAKRPPNKWQLYLSTCLPGQPKDAGLGQRVSACSVSYKDLKAKDSNKLEEIIKLAKIKTDHK